MTLRITVVSTCTLPRIGTSSTGQPLNCGVGETAVVCADARAGKTGISAAHTAKVIRAAATCNSLALTQVPFPRFQARKAGTSVVAPALMSKTPLLTAVARFGGSRGCRAHRPVEACQWSSTAGMDAMNRPRCRGRALEMMNEVNARADQPADCAD